jgi:hypothetical protein
MYPYVLAARFGLDELLSRPHRACRTTHRSARALGDLADEGALEAKVAVGAPFGRTSGPRS